MRIFGCNFDRSIRKMNIVNARLDGGWHVLQTFQSVKSSIRLPGDDLH